MAISNIGSNGKGKSMDPDVEKFIKESQRSINCLKFDVMIYGKNGFSSNYHNAVGKFIEQEITDTDKVNIMDNYDFITDFSELELHSFEFSNEADGNESCLVFRDQDNNLRQVTILGDDIPGMVAYHEKLNIIKNDLIREINMGFQWKQYLYKQFEGNNGDNG